MYYNDQHYIGGAHEFISFVSRVYGSFYDAKSKDEYKARGDAELERYFMQRSGTCSYAYMDFTLGGSETKERVIFELFKDKVCVLCIVSSKAH